MEDKKNVYIVILFEKYLELLSFVPADMKNNFANNAAKSIEKSQSLQDVHDFSLPAASSLLHYTAGNQPTISAEKTSASRVLNKMDKKSSCKIKKPNKMQHKIQQAVNTNSAPKKKINYKQLWFKKLT